MQCFCEVDILIFYTMLPISWSGLHLEFGIENRCCHWVSFWTEAISILHKNSNWVSEWVQRNIINYGGNGSEPSLTFYLHLILDASLSKVFLRRTSCWWRCWSSAQSGFIWSSPLETFHIPWVLSFFTFMCWIVVEFNWCCWTIISKQNAEQR